MYTMLNGFTRKIAAKKKSAAKKGKKEKFLINLKDSENCEGEARLSSCILSAGFSVTGYISS